LIAVIAHGYLDLFARAFVSFHYALSFRIELRGKAFHAQTPTLIGCSIFKEHAVLRSAQKRNYAASFFVCQVAPDVRLA
jgi:hypothetical protein